MGLRRAILPLALVLGAGLWKPPSAAALDVGDVVAAVRGVSDGSVGATLGDVEAILAAILETPPAPGPEDLGAFLVELTAGIAGLAEPRYLATAFLDFHAVGPPGLEGAREVSATLRFAAPNLTDFGWEVSPASCVDLGGAVAPDPDVDGWLRLETGPATLPGLPLGEETATLAGASFSALLAADAGGERLFTLQGESDLSQAATDPPGLLALYGVTALYVNGAMLTEEERALPGVGDRLPPGCP